ncbi:MAG TPA: ATP-binding protein [Candidatus Nitrosotenuis sp.]
MRKFIVRKDGDSELSLQTKSVDPMSFTERSVFFKKDSQNNASEDTLEQESEDLKSNKGQQTSEFADVVEKENQDGDSDDRLAQSKEIKKLFDESLYAVKAFTENKTKLLQKNLEEEKQLTKQLNETLQQNLLKISKIDEDLEHRKNHLEVEVDEKTKKLLASEKMTAIGELSARLAHDIKNPLTMIKNTVKILRTQEGKQIDEYVLKRFDMVDDSIFRISHQIDGVLDYLKCTPLKTAPASLVGILKSSILPLSIPANVKINFPSADLTLKCDAIKMEIVFGNILLNSLQAIADTQGQIYVRFAKKPGSVIIELVDSGPGIAQEHIEKIFDPLFTTKQKGTGLGLTSCKNIIDQHGGKISAKTNPTTFTIVLPAPETK